MSGVKRQRVDGAGKAEPRLPFVSIPTSSDPLVNEADFQALRDEMEQYDAAREVIIKRSREVLKGAKSAIFSLHRGNAEEARKLIEKAVGVAVELLGRIEEEKKPGLRNGAMSSAIEELVEAMAFQHFLNHGTCIRKDDLLKEYGIQVTTDEYLGGVLDVRREGA